MGLMIGLLVAGVVSADSTGPVVPDAARDRPTPETRIIAPPEHSSTGRDRIHVVGRSGAPAVDVYLNDLLVRTAVVKDSVFHALVWLPFGLNRIDAESIGAERGDGSGAVEVLAGPRIPREYERLFEPYAFHNGTPAAECLRCHDGSMDASEGGRDRCLECHGLIEERFTAHVGPEGTCNTCHRMGEDLTFQGNRVYSDMNPCFGCHRDKIGEFAQQFIHGPVAAGGCTVCHDPHGSRYEKSLQSPVPLLCLYCHSDLNDADRHATVHRPFEQGDCVSCHDPHSTNNRWVLIKNSQELCVSCHREDGDLAHHEHPYNVKPRRKGYYELSLTDRGQLECVSCHDPHYSNARHLLRAEQGNSCVGCHPDQE